MKIDLTMQFNDLDGKPLTMEDKPFPLRKILSLACLNASGDDTPSVEAKYKVYKLMRRINSQADSIDLKADDIVLLKKLVSKIYPVYLTGVTIEALDGPDADEHGKPDKRQLEVVGAASN